jgi:gephyrin
MSSQLRAAILIVSDTAAKDPSTDKCIPALRDVFSQISGDRWDVGETKIVSDDEGSIVEAVKSWTDGGEGGVNLVVTSGGTGFTGRDRTPEVRCPRYDCD